MEHTCLGIHRCRSSLFHFQMFNTLIAAGKVVANGKDVWLHFVLGSDYKVFNSNNNIIIPF